MPNQKHWTDTTMEQLAADDAFERAIESGRLSRDPKADNYAGHYMYMGPRADGRGDAFKHSLTRQYLA